MDRGAAAAEAVARETAAEAVARETAAAVARGRRRYQAAAAAVARGAAVEVDPHLRPGQWMGDGISGEEIQPLTRSSLSCLLSGISSNFDTILHFLSYRYL